MFYRWLTNRKQYDTGILYNFCFRTKLVDSHALHIQVPEPTLFWWQTVKRREWTVVSIPVWREHIVLARKSGDFRLRLQTWEHWHCLNVFKRNSVVFKKKYCYIIQMNFMWFFISFNSWSNICLACCTTTTAHTVWCKIPWKQTARFSLPLLTRLCLWPLGPKKRNLAHGPRSERLSPLVP